MPIQLGNVAPATQLVFAFNTHKADGTPWTLDGTPTVRVRWYGGEDPQYSDSAAVLTVNSGSITGYHVVEVDTTGIAAGLDCSVYLTAGTVDGVSVAGTVLALFSVSNRVPTAAQAANLDAAVSTRLASASYTTPPTAAANADAVWDEATSGHTGTGSFGKLIGTTWATLFTGITSLANWLKAMIRSSTADSTALTEIGGSTYDVTTDSLEALGAKVTSYPIEVTPISVTTPDGDAAPPSPLRAWQYRRAGPWTITVTDSDGVAIDLRALNLTFLFWQAEDTSNVQALKKDGTHTEITVTGASNNQAVVLSNDDTLGTAGLYYWLLIDETNDRVLQTVTGKLFVEEAPETPA